MAQAKHFRLTEDNLKGNAFVHTEYITVTGSDISTPASVQSSSNSVSELPTPAAGPNDVLLQHSVNVVTGGSGIGKAPQNSSGYLSFGEPIQRTVYPWLIASPYVEPEHQLDLTTLDVHSQLFAQALVSLTYASKEYAIAPYNQALNWPTVFNNLRTLSAAQNHTWKSSTFYVVEFRSQLKPKIDNPLLFKLDKESHREATASGGLLKYWYGEPDARRRNLATCLWRAKEDAIAGGKGPWHKQARSITPRMYESINVEGLKLTIYDGISGWRFEKWIE